MRHVSFSTVLLLVRWLGNWEQVDLYLVVRESFVL